MKTRIARREFLRQFSLGLGAYGLQSVFLDGLMGQILNAAYASTSSASATAKQNVFYVYLSMEGGPPRWNFDLPLTPMGQTSKNFLPGAFGTTLATQGGLAKAVYDARQITVAGKTLHLPPVWTMGLSGHSFNKILQNTLMIRGVDMEINNHVLSNRRQVSPVIGGYSLTGFVADATGRPLPGIIDTSTSAADAFRSKNGYSGSSISYTESNTANPVKTLLNPFVEYRNGKAFHNATATAMNEQALVHFEDYAARSGLTSSSVFKMYDAALELVNKKVVTLEDKWDATVAKYRAVITEAVHPRKGTLPGLFDSTIPGNSTDHPALIYAQGSSTSLSDLRDMVNEDTNVPRMAQNFAVTEILLGDLTTSATLNMNALSGLWTGTTKVNFSHDHHFVGSAVSVLVDTLFYRAMLGCLCVFKDALIAKGIYDKTIIHIGSEFSRTPRTNASGSDHGFMGSSVSIISGMIKKPAVIGNIQVSHLSDGYQGTFGVAANSRLPSGEKRPIRVNDIARSLSAMLGVGDVTTNGEPLVKSNDGLTWTPKKEEAENV